MNSSLHISQQVRRVRHRAGNKRAVWSGNWSLTHRRRSSVDAIYRQFCPSSTLLAVCRRLRFAPDRLCCGSGAYTQDVHYRSDRTVTQSVELSLFCGMRYFKSPPPQKKIYSHECISVSGRASRGQDPLDSVQRRSILSYGRKWEGKSEEGNRKTEKGKAEIVQSLCVEILG